MKITLISLVIFVLFIVTSEAGNTLWYNKPSTVWTEALPIGNGRLGAMVFGEVKNERIQFNEDTLWTGKPHDYTHPDAFKSLSHIRQLIFEGKKDDALKLTLSNFMSVPLYQMAYQPFADLLLNFTGHDSFSNYRRDLDLDSAVATVSYKVNDVTYKREVFASFPDQVIVVHLSADKTGHISFTSKLSTLHKDAHSKVIGSDTLSIAGSVESGGLKFEARAHVMAVGGKTTASGDSVTVDKADKVTIYLVAATSYKNYHDISADPAERVTAQLTKLSKRDYNSVSNDHLTDHRNLFRRVKLDLGHTARSDLPTNERLQKGPDGDADFVTLYFNFGRYLLISSSRAGSQPPNLQGIWNQEKNPPWGSKWTTNINTEMNYWGSELTNLEETVGPLFDLIDDLVITGGHTAKVHYNASGWVFHHNADLWRGAAPIDGEPGIWPTGGAWMSHHLWEHYLFTGDKDFLSKRAYPVMKKAAQFFLDSLVKHPKYGWMVTAPSISPEQGGVCAGPTMDNQLIRALFSYVVEASHILNEDKDFAAKVAEMSKHVPPNLIGKHGQLQEWLEDIDDPKNEHRHMSPLWALYPGNEITPENKTIMDAAKTLMNFRGDGSTGWSAAWRLNLWARVRDGEHAYKILLRLMQQSTLPNLFDNHPPFQIDGNFGGSAGIAELLLQSHIRDSSGTVQLDLLPALPSAWPKGSITGLRARGGFEVSISWDNHQLTKATIHSILGNVANVRHHSNALHLKTEKGKNYNLSGNLALQP